jgi:DNA-binding NarL/FixJ family response regulator
MKKPDSKTKVLLADDHLVVRMGLSAIISLEKDMTVVAEAENGEDAVRLAAEKKPDVVVMDLMMPKLDGARATAEIMAANPATKVIILTTFGGSIDVKRALDAGATSALVKATSQKDLIEAIRRTAAGESIICSEISNTLESDADSVDLSERQFEILSYVAKGLNNREIAELMHVSRDCIKAHLKTIFAKLGVASRSEAVALAVNRSMVKV